MILKDRKPGLRCPKACKGSISETHSAIWDHSNLRFRGSVLKLHKNILEPYGKLVLPLTALYIRASVYECAFCLLEVW